jgi:isochorismate hydrolase
MEDRVQGPLVPELVEILPEAYAARIGRRKLFVAGITTEICVTFPVLQMLDEGYEVQVSADASASYTKYGDELALRRMEKAGAIIVTIDQIISELAIDWTSPNGQKLATILEYR